MAVGLHLALLLLAVPALALDLEKFHLIRENNFALSQLEQESNCPKFMCNPEGSGVNMSPLTCIHYENFAFYLQKCPQQDGIQLHCSKVRPISDTDHYCTNYVHPPMHSWPGEDCHYDSDCKYGYCNTTDIRNRCVGQLHGDPCTVSDECNPGLYCSVNNLCEPQRGLEQPCTHFWQCQNNLGCNVTDVTGGKCLPYFSVAEGGYVSHCGTGGQYFCQSGTCTMTPLPDIGVCSAPAVSDKSLPTKCTLNSDCSGKSGSVPEITQCECGMNADGNAYCLPFIGDAPGLNLLKAWEKIWKVNGTGSCNTMRRFQTACLHSLETTEAYDAYMAEMWINFYPILQGNDDCVRSVFNGFYWGAGAGTLVLSYLALFFLAN